MAKVYRFQTHVEAKRVYGSIRKYREVLKLQEEARDEYHKVISKLKKATAFPSYISPALDNIFDGGSGNE